MLTWMKEVVSELQPLESFDLDTPALDFTSHSKAPLSRGSFCCNYGLPVQILIELLEIHGNQVRHKKRQNILLIKEKMVL